MDERFAVRPGDFCYSAHEDMQERRYKLTAVRVMPAQRSAWRSEVRRMVIISPKPQRWSESAVALPDQRSHDCICHSRCSSPNSENTKDLLTCPRQKKPRSASESAVWPNKPGRGAFNRRNSPRNTEREVPGHKKTQHKKKTTI